MKASDLDLLDRIYDELNNISELLENLKDKSIKEALERKILELVDLIDEYIES